MKYIAQEVQTTPQAKQQLLSCQWVEQQEQQEQQVEQHLMRAF